MLPLKTLDLIAYDCEVIRGPLKAGEERLPGVEYAAGWTDFEGMGVACCCAVDCYTGQVHVYLGDNLHRFEALAKERRYVAGWNTKAFDDKLLAAHGITVESNFDLFALFRETVKDRTPGRKLDDFARANLGVAKPIQDHAMLPAMWQCGQHGAVVEECLSDCYLLVALIKRLPTLIDPVTGRGVTLPAPIDSKQLELLGAA